MSSNIFHLTRSAIKLIKTILLCSLTYFATLAGKSSKMKTSSFLSTYFTSQVHLQKLSYQRWFLILPSSRMKFYTYSCSNFEYPENVQCVDDGKIEYKSTNHYSNLVIKWQFRYVECAHDDDLLKVNSIIKNENPIKMNQILRQLFFMVHRVHGLIISRFVLFTFIFPFLSFRCQQTAHSVWQEIIE